MPPLAPVYDVVQRPYSTLTQSEDYGTLYTHAGSNTMWLAEITLIPEKRAVIIASTNTPLSLSKQAIQEATHEAQKFLK